MNKDEKLIITFLGKDGEVLLRKPLTSVPLTEEAVLRLSMEFFQDPEPCMIHRSAVMSRMYMELLEYSVSLLEQGNSNSHISEIPESLVSYIDINGFQRMIVNI